LQPRVRGYAAGKSYRAVCAAFERRP
jgi:tRNA A37 threonylcarbamoyltransferase TsaD